MRRCAPLVRPQRQYLLFLIKNQTNSRTVFRPALCFSI
jgi:hypothetical protein